MKITVYGGTNNKEYTPKQMQACEKLGEYLGKSGATVLTGACRGFPYYVGKAAIKHGAKVLGYTPGMNLDEHIKVYDFPTDGVTDLVYPKVKYPTMSESFLRRSMDMTPFSDVVIAMGGSWGTFGELLMSFMLKRTIILIEEFEGAVKAFEDAYDFFGARDINPAVHNGAKIIKVKTVDECIQKMSKLKV
ncbi:MAG: hypothetical protein LBG88_04560 [Christensenellaceae bacterium]|jgi:predicted Rossmann-fold nucleotide-binding protein|nr:hypothetical protein [Christensenellaceae bacterium]